jgi:RNA polymerase sigma factor (sigma-70 family)
MFVHHGKRRGLGPTTEATLFHQAQRGNRSALDRLMAQHEGLVHAVLRRYGSGPLAYSEALQAGRLGLWHALLKFDPDRGLAFSTYAWPSIMRHLGRAVKSERRFGEHYRAATLWLPTPTLDLDTWADTLGVQQAVRALVQRLEPRGRQTITAYYGLAQRAPSDFTQIGQSLAVSAERARQLHQEALIWLRQPAHAQELRSLLGRHRLADYQGLTALNRRWWRGTRGRHAD